ncbi:MotA/TolQ/ExbB proton channel family protein [Kiloniella laminariae]|uniref:MotA/TolQ/ExbB proton channel family protein n=1 Tax=Kiloniella laminariae TaxID=454162 RepID=A0ABT4LM90_9PROT|nr:MotA/TolQ/ExbB proton channel family protein [Kiloniella laminariae]MCZ4282194.1 MotA/TolQ/ExbB proton channel family protein [Kiloniella laminariae]
MILPDLFARLGPVGWPLAVFSFLAALLLLERTFFFLRLRSGIAAGSISPDQMSLEQEAGKPGPMAEAIAITLQHSTTPVELREEALKIWLRSYSGKIRFGLRFLMLIAVICPLLGLFGTVLGMIEAFKVIAVQEGPLHPALLADGIWQAMLTTAAGLVIALPSLLGAHGFRILADRHIEKLGLGLSHLSLSLSLQQHGPATGLPEKGRQS